MGSLIYIFWTCRDEPEARKVIHALLEKTLIACASILPGVRSIYRWEGQVEESEEVKVILKTRKSHFHGVQELIRKNCSYQVPEILQVDVAEGNLDYMKWVHEETEV